jgi:quercetin dioxygenase-like cupin family protein
MSMTDSIANPAKLDAMVAAPDHHAVLIENPRVRGLGTRLAPGERTPVHEHQWPVALYILSWSDFIRYAPNGEVLVDSRSLSSRPVAGQALWSGPLPPHYVHNVGSSDLHIIAVEIKGNGDGPDKSIKPPPLRGPA